VAKRKRQAASNSPVSGSSGVSATEKIAALLALIAIRDMDTDEAAIRLDGIGFSAREISSLLDVSLNYVNVAKHRKKRSGGKAKKTA
jgi:DNA-directed RNA polymerase specialized sigma24 family protein